MLHVHYTIDRLAPDRFGAWFTVRNGRIIEPMISGVELEQTYPDRLTAIRSVMDAIEAHMARRYNLGANEFTVEERSSGRYHSCRAVRG